MSTTIDNRVIVRAPFDTVWAMTNDIESWPDLFSEYAAAEVLDRRPNWVLFRLTTVPDADGSTWTWVSERTLDPASRSVAGRRLDTWPFQHMHITWTYREVDDGVEMRWRQDFTMQPGFRFDDQHMRARLDAATKEQIRQVASAVERAARAQVVG